jgi:hypothetical protein
MRRRAAASSGARALRKLASNYAVIKQVSNFSFCRI